MTVWAYYETDGDAGWYSIELFRTKESAERHRRKVDSAYGRISPLEVQPEPGTVPQSRSSHPRDEKSKRDFPARSKYIG
jgi:hypothetical protein